MTNQNNDEGLYYEAVPDTIMRLVEKLDSWGEPPEGFKNAIKYLAGLIKEYRARPLLDTKDLERTMLDAMVKCRVVANNTIQINADNAAQACASIATRHAANLGDEVERLKKEKNAMLERILEAANPHIPGDDRQRCRDCADEDGRCPDSGKLCDPFEAVIELLTSLSKTPE